MSIKKLPGIHVREPWSQLLLSGRKTVETRSYPLPSKYLNEELALIETHGSKKPSEIIGTVVFKECFLYENRVDWEKDYERHLVPPQDHQFGFSLEREKWAWVVSRIKTAASKTKPPVRRGIRIALNCTVKLP